MYKETSKLRLLLINNKKKLQQQWIDDDPVDEGMIRYVWRDITVVKEEETKNE